MEPGEHAVEEQLDQIFQHQEPDRPSRLASRHPDEAIDLRRQRQQPVHRAPILLAAQLERHDEAHVGNERERMRRVDRERRQHREGPRHEPGVKPGGVRVGQSGDLAYLDADSMQQNAQFTPYELLIGQQ